MKKKLAILAALAMTMSMFTACGNDDSSSSAPAADNNSSVADDTSSDTPSESDTSADESSDENTSPENDPSESEAEPFEFDGTLETTGDYPGDWNTPQFIIDNEGNTSGQFDYVYLEDYRDTGCSITIDYVMDKKIDMQNPDAGKVFYDFYSVAPCSAGASGWVKLYETNNDYITGLGADADVLVEDPEDPSNKVVRDDYDLPAYLQSDGFIVIRAEDDGTWADGSVTFQLSAEGLQFVLDDLGDTDDGGKWGGLIFMVHGLNIQSVTVSAPAE